MKKNALALLSLAGLKEPIRELLVAARRVTHIPRYRAYRFKWKVIRLFAVRFLSTFFNFSSKSDLDYLLSFFRVFSTNRELVRIGSPQDGGYLVPNDLKGIAANISLGVGNDSNFEAALADLGIPSFMADGSVEGPALDSELFHFRKLYIGDGPGEEWVSFEEYLDHVDVYGDLILSMDIEGGEYDVLSDISPNILRRFRIITIEFHDLDLIFLRNNLVQVLKIVRKLTAEHTMVHLHPNTLVPLVKYLGIGIPPVLEITLLRNDRIERLENVAVLPNELDRKNAPWTREIYLQPEWYR